MKKESLWFQFWILFIRPHYMGQSHVLCPHQKGCILISDLHPDQQSPPLIPGTCSSPGIHITIRSPEAGRRTDRQTGLSVYMLVASLLPGQMAWLLEEEEASWRGVTALQRAQSSGEQKCWQLLTHLPKSKETGTPMKMCIRLCFPLL